MEKYDEFFRSICRVCLSPESRENVVSLIDETTKDGLSCFGQAAITFADIRLENDFLPSSMCKNCLLLLKQAIVFKKKSENSQEKLSNLVRNTKGSESEIKEKVTQYVMFMHYFPQGCIEEPSKIDKTVKRMKNPPNKFTLSSNSNNFVKIESTVEIEDKKMYVDENNDESKGRYENEQSDSDDNENSSANEDIGTTEEQEIDCLLDGIEKAIKMNPQTLNCDRKKYKQKRVTKRKLKSKSQQKSLFAKGEFTRRINIPCKICNKVLKNVTMYRRHMRRHNPPLEEQRNIQCKICNKVLANMATYKGHMQRHDGFRYVCEHCAKGFAIYAQLQYHQAAVHDIGPFYYCNQCDYKAPRKWDLVIHERFHTGERPYACDKCGLTFRRRFVWKKHALYHMEKTVQCPRCPRKFHQRGEMLAHANNVHERVYVYACTKCDVTYAKTGTVRRHLVEKHGIAREMQGKISRINLRKSSIRKD